MAGLLVPGYRARGNNILPGCLFYPEVHEELAKTKNAPFSASLRQTSLVALTSLDTGEAKGYVDVPQVERAIEVTFVPAHRHPPEGPTKAPFQRISIYFISGVESLNCCRSSCFHT